MSAESPYVALAKRPKSDGGCLEKLTRAQGSQYAIRRILRAHSPHGHFALAGGAQSGRA